MCAKGLSSLAILRSMTRRDLLRSSAFVAAGACSPIMAIAENQRLDVNWYTRSRRFAELSFGRIAYVEHGRGPAALFIHGYPLNGYQWRGALERLHGVRRCIAPDLMGLGYSEPSASQAITPHTQAEMLAALLDHLKVESVDLVANDSGGITAQIFIALYPHRVRSLLMTNCDVDTNNPPPQFAPFIELARKGILADRFIVSQLQNKELARSQKGMGQAFSYPEKLTDETIEYYLSPIASTAERREQFHAYTIALGQNILVPVREQLHSWNGHARMVWGLKDAFFPVEWADWLNTTLPGARGVKRVPDANLFFPEEMPDLIAGQAKMLWDIGPKTAA